MPTPCKNHASRIFFNRNRARRCRVANLDFSKPCVFTVPFLWSRVVYSTCFQQLIKNKNFFEYVFSESMYFTMFLKQFSIESPILKPMWNCRMHIKSNYFFVFLLGGKCVMKFIEIAKTMLFHSKNIIFFIFQFGIWAVPHPKRIKNLRKNSDFINMHLSRKCWIHEKMQLSQRNPHNHIRRHAHIHTHAHVHIRTHLHLYRMLPFTSMAPPHWHPRTHKQTRTHKYQQGLSSEMTPRSF